MARNLHPDTQRTADQQEVQRIAHLFVAELDEQTIRLTNADKNIDITSGNATHSFASVGSLGAVSAVEEGAELQAYAVEVSLSAIDDTLIAVAQQIHVQGRTAKIYLALLDENSNLLGYPILLFAGRIDTMRWQAGDEPSLTLTIRSPLADWERNKLSRYTHSEQKTLFPQDNFFEYLTAISQKTITWGS